MSVYLKKLSLDAYLFSFPLVLGLSLGLGLVLDLDLAFLTLRLGGRWMRLLVRKDVRLEYSIISEAK